MDHGPPSAEWLDEACATLGAKASQPSGALGLRLYASLLQALAALHGGGGSGSDGAGAGAATGGGIGSDDASIGSDGAYATAIGSGGGGGYSPPASAAAALGATCRRLLRPDRLAASLTQADREVRQVEDANRGIGLDGGGGRGGGGVVGMDLGGGARGGSVRVRGGSGPGRSASAGRARACVQAEVVVASSVGEICEALGVLPWADPGLLEDALAAYSDLLLGTATSGDEYSDALEPLSPLAAASLAAEMLVRWAGDKDGEEGGGGTGGDGGGALPTESSASIALLGVALQATEQALPVLPPEATLCLLEALASSALDAPPSWRECLFRARPPGCGSDGDADMLSRLAASLVMLGWRVPDGWATRITRAVNEQLKQPGSVDGEQAAAFAVFLSRQLAESTQAGVGADGLEREGVDDGRVDKDGGGLEGLPPARLYVAPGAPVPARLIGMASGGMGMADAEGGGGGGRSSGGGGGGGRGGGRGSGSQGGRGAGGSSGSRRSGGTDAGSSSGGGGGSGGGVGAGWVLPYVGPPFLRSLEGTMVRDVEELSVPGLAVGALGLLRLGHTPSDIFWEAVERATTPALVGGCPGRSLVALLLARALAGPPRPLRAWLEGALLGAGAARAQLGPGDWSALLWAAGQLHSAAAGQLPGGDGDAGAAAGAESPLEARQRHHPQYQGGGGSDSGAPGCVPAEWTARAACAALAHAEEMDGTQLTGCLIGAALLGHTFGGAGEAAAVSSAACAALARGDLPTECWGQLVAALAVLAVPPSDDAYGSTYGAYDGGLGGDARDALRPLLARVCEACTLRGQWPAAPGCLLQLLLALRELEFDPGQAFVDRHAAAMKGANKRAAAAARDGAAAQQVRCGVCCC
ncbi:hypothetical protein FOA52_012741 [Chlamydomonas sp. UWO 241]|nr:hypothetical protein FOA52_012741 [Chlamydomonas sp. UWO 241]